MKTEARIIKRYLFRERQTMPGQCGYSMLVMEDGASREIVSFYIKADNRDEMLFIRKLEGCTLDDTDRHLREIELIGDGAVKKFEECYGTAAETAMQPVKADMAKNPSKAGTPAGSTAVSSTEKPAQDAEKTTAGSAPSVAASKTVSAQPVTAAEEKKPTPLKPMPRKRVISAEEEEREKAKSLAMLQKNSLIDYRYNRKGDLVKTMMEGSEAALVSDVFSVIALVNRRMADDIRPQLLSMLPYYHNNDFDMEYQLTVNKETTIRYVVNESGLITACTVNGAKYPLCLTILMILRQLAEDAEDGMDAFHERIMDKMKADMDREKKMC